MGKLAQGVYEMSAPEFASAPFTAGQLNALVKIVWPENVPGILNGSLKVTVDQSGLLKRITTVTANGAKRFVCDEARNVGRRLELPLGNPCVNVRNEFSILGNG